MTITSPLILNYKELIESHVACRLNGYVGGYGRLAAFDREWEGLGLNDKMADYVRRQVQTNFRGTS